MKSKSSLKSFRSEVSAAMGCVGTGMLPCAGLIHIEVKEDATIFMANNLDFGIKTKVESEDCEPGVTVVSAQMLNAWVARAEGEPIALKAASNAGRVAFISGAARCSLSQESYDNFPEFPKPTLNTLAKLPSSQLVEIMSGVLPVIANFEDSRFNYSGSQLTFEQSESSLTVAALDGNRMAFSNSKLPFIATDSKVVISRKSVSEIIRQCVKFDGDVVIAQSDANLFFAIGKRILYVRRISDAFAKWKPVLDSMVDQIVIPIDSDKLISALNRVSVLQKDSKKVVVNFNKDGGTISLVSDTADGTDFFEVVYNGDQIRFGINSDWLVDALKIVGSEADICFINDKKAIEVRRRGDMSYRNLIMPMAV